MKKVKLITLVTLLLTVVFALSACGGGGFNGSGLRRYRAESGVRDSYRFVRSSDTVSLPSGASEPAFLGHDLISFSVTADGNMTHRNAVWCLIDWRALPNLGGATGADFSGGNHIAVIASGSSRYTAIYIAVRDVNDNWALFDREGRTVFGFNNFDFDAPGTSPPAFTIIGSDHISMGGDIWRVSGNNPQRVIQGVNSVERIGNSLFNSAANIVYDLNGEVLYVARNVASFNHPGAPSNRFVVLSGDRGLYVTNVVAPWDASRFDFYMSDSWGDGLKIRQTVETVNFRSGNRSSVNFNYAILTDTTFRVGDRWVATQGWTSAQRYQITDRMEGSVLVSNARVIESRVLTEQRAFLITNDRLRVSENINANFTASHVLARNRFLVVHPEISGHRLIDNNGNILRHFPAGAVSFNNGAGVLVTNNDNAYDANGRRVVDSNDFVAVEWSNARGGLVPARVEVTVDETQYIETVMLNARTGARVGAVITSTRADAPAVTWLHINGIYHMTAGEAGNQSRVYRNYEGTVVATIDLANFTIVGDVAATGGIQPAVTSNIYSRYISLTPVGDGVRQIVRMRV